MSQKVTKYWRVVLLGTVVSLLAIYFIASQIDLPHLGAALRTARYIYVLPCILLLLAGLLTRAIRWRVLLSGGLNVRRAFSITNVSYLVNGLLPLRIGEVVRAYLATRAEPPVPVFKSISTIIVERLLDLLAVLVLVLLALSGGPLPGEIRAAAVVAAPLVLVGFLVLVLLASQRVLALRLLKMVTSRIVILQRWNVAEWLNHFLDGLKPLTQTAALVQALLWTAFSWGFSVAAGYVLMLAFYDQASWAATCLFIAAASFAIAVPAVPGNLGTYELSILLALNAMGYGASSSTSGAFAVVVHGVNLAVYAVMGVVGFVQEGVSLEQLSQGVRGIQQRTS